MSESIWSGSITGTIVRLAEVAGHDTSQGNTATCLQAAADRIRQLETALAVAYETCTENCVSPEHADPELARPILDTWIRASHIEPDPEETT